MGIILHPNCYESMLHRYGYKMHWIFTTSDIVEIIPVIKYSNYIDLATGILNFIIILFSKILKENNN
jgi:hypothetical protein